MIVTVIDVCGCGHPRDEHWWSGFVCAVCGCDEYHRGSR
jgi:hypothetical protein